MTTPKAKTNGRVTNAQLQEELQTSQEAQRELALLANQETMSLQERISELELVLQDNDADWMALGGDSSMEFSRTFLTGIVRTARLMFLKNPLIKRAVRVQANYIFGQGFSVSCPDQAVDGLVQRFMEDKANTRVLTSQQAAGEAEKELTVTGNLFIALFTDENSGRVVLRLIPVEEIPSIITNPEDRQEPWYYRRDFQVGEVDANTGMASTEPLTLYYPDWQYNPTRSERLATIQGHEVCWDCPVYHVAVGGFSHMKFGVPEIYAALDWARAVTRDLEDYASTKRALSRWAWNMTVVGGKRGVSAIQSKFNTTIADGADQGETNPPPTTGSMFVGTAGNRLEPMRTAGAQPSPEEGRRLGLMVAAGVGLPETMLFGNADAGNLATAKTLDRPTELQMADRQEMWKTIFEDLTSFVVIKGVESKNGLLNEEGNKVVADTYTGETIVMLGGTGEDGEERSTHCNVEFPSILERDTITRVQAIIQAATTGSQPIMTHETFSRLLLTALGVDDVSAEWEALQPELEAAEERRSAMASIFSGPGDDEEEDEDDEDDGDGEEEDGDDGEPQAEARINRALRVTRKLRKLDEVLRGVA